MTDNIEKLYELAKVEKIKTCYWNCKHSFPCKECCIYKDETVDFVSSPFTSEKQLELIKWLATKFILGNFKGIDDGLYNFNLCLTVTPLNKHIISEHIEYKQALAGLVCELWEDLTDTQREEIKRILE